MNILIAFIFYMNINYLFKKKKLIEKKMALRNNRENKCVSVYFF